MSRWDSSHKDSTAVLKCISLFHMFTSWKASTVSEELILKGSILSEKHLEKSIWWIRTKCSNAHMETICSKILFMCWKKNHWLISTEDVSSALLETGSK